MKTNVLLISIMLMIPVWVFCQGVMLKPGTKITLNESSTIKLINGGDLLLKDDNLNSPSLLQKGTISFSGGGEAIVEQFLSKDVWHSVASPVIGATIESFMWMYLYQYDEASADFQSVNYPLTTPLNIGQGYFVWPYTTDPNGIYPPSPDLAVLAGTPNYQNVNLNLEYTASSPNPGWNLFGNPFPCAINWNDHADWNRNNVDAAVYVYDNGSGGGTTGNYRVYNWNTGIGIPDGNDGVIAATQGFWLHTSTTGASVTIPASQRLHADKAFYKGSDENWNNLLRLSVDHPTGTFKCETVILFSDATTSGFDNDYDSYYIEGHEDAPALYTVITGDNYGINCLPSFVDNPLIPLSFYSAAGGEYSISASNIESFPLDLPIWLEDKKDKYFHNLKNNPEYLFISEAGEDPDRFNILFTEPDNFENSIFNNVQIYSWQNAVYVKIPENVEANIYVYSLLGELIDSRSTNDELNIIPVKQDKVYYVVKVISEQKIKTKKVYIN